VPAPEGERELHLPQLRGAAQTHLRLPHRPGPGRLLLRHRLRLPRGPAAAARGREERRHLRRRQEDQEGSRSQNIHSEGVWKIEEIIQGTERGNS